MDSLLGKILKNQYYVARQLAKKNYWTIYLAEDRLASIEPICVIKRLQIPKEVKKISSQAWNELRDLVTLEVMRLKQIDNHPQIPEIRDFFLINRDFYVVRDFIKGETLAEEIAHHPLTEAEVILVLKEILKCLDFIHQKNLLHLSLKPSNIIRQQKDRKIFLTILSKLKRLAEDKIWQPRFLINQHVEDQEFIAPEYQQGNPVIASDIYTLGKIAIYALSGSKSNKVEINNLDHLARSAIRDLNSNQEISISSKLANILNKMTCDRVIDRYQSATEVLHDLEEEENVVLFPPPFEMENPEEQDILQLSQNKKNNIIKNQRKISKTKRKRNILWRILFIPLATIMFLGVMVFNNILKYRDFINYNNESYNISFKYPQDWSLEELEDPITGDIAVLTAPLESGFDLFQEKIYFAIDELPEEVNSLDLYSQTMFKKIRSQLDPDIIIYQGDIENLDGNKARSLMYLRQEGTTSLQQMEIFTVKGNRAYIFTYVAEDTKYHEFLKITKKILGSLEIREQEEKR